MSSHSDSHSSTAQRSHPAPWMLPALFLIGFGPLLLKFFANLWRFEVHQFFPLALLGAGVLAWRGLQETPSRKLPRRRQPDPQQLPDLGQIEKRSSSRRRRSEGSSFITSTLGLLALALLTVATLLWSPWLGMAAALVALAAIVWWLGGRTLAHSLFPAWIMLFTVVPPPLKLDARLALALQQFAVAGSNRILDLLAVPHLRSGNILEIPGQRLLVEEACSGINSVLFMTAVCVFFAMWQRRSLFFLVVLYVLTIGFILFGNLLRITLGAFLLFDFHINLFIGWRHETLGLVLTASYLVFIVVAENLLGKLFAALRKARNQETPTEEAPPQKSAEELGVSLPQLLSSPIITPRLLLVGAYLLVLFGLQLYQAWHYSKKAIHERRINPAQMDGSAKFSLPPQIGLWTRISDEKPASIKTAFEDGVYSHIWRYQRKGLVATISLDYPFFDYHDVRICYTGAGWTVAESTVKRADDTRDKIPQMEVVLSKESGLNGTLLYSTVDQFGKWLDDTGHRAMYDSQGRTFEGGFLGRIAYRLNTPTQVEDGTVNYRIQLLAVAQGGLDTLQLADVRTLFEDVRKLLAEQFVIHPKETKKNGKIDVHADALPAPMQMEAMPGKAGGDSFE